MKKNEFLALRVELKRSKSDQEGTDTSNTANSAEEEEKEKELEDMPSDPDDDDESGNGEFTGGDALVLEVHPELIKYMKEHKFRTLRIIGMEQGDGGLEFRVRTVKRRR